MEEEPHNSDSQDFLLACRSDDDNHNQPEESTDASTSEEMGKPHVPKIDQPATKNTRASESKSAARKRVKLKVNELATKSETTAEKVVVLKDDQPTAKPIETLKSKKAANDQGTAKHNLATKSETASGRTGLLRNIAYKSRKKRLYPPDTYIRCIQNNEQSLTSAVLNMDNSFLACGYEDSSIYVWNLYDCESEEEIEDESVSKVLENEQSPLDTSLSSVAHFLHNTKRRSQALRGHYGSVYGLSFTSIPNFLMSCSEDSTVRLWNLKTFQNVALYSGHSSVVWDIDVSSSCSYFATSSMDSTCCLWSFSRDSPLRSFTGHEHDVSCVKFHPNEDYIASASSNGLILLWTTLDALPVRCLRGHLFGVSSITFSNNGKYLASGDNGGNILIWDIASGREVKEFQGHTSRVQDLRFNPSDSVLASCSLDKTVRLWDVRSTINEERFPSKSKYISIVSEHKVWAIPKFLHYKENRLLTVLAGVTAKT